METGARPWPLDDPSGFQVSIASNYRAPFEARMRASNLGDWLPTGVLSDLRTVLSELVTNCVKHGSGGAIGVTVRVTTAGVVRGFVEDGGCGTVALALNRPVGDGGLGLLVVDRLVSRWGVEPGTSDVWFELAPAADARAKSAPD